jgi:hypothetical protein
MLNFITSDGGKLETNRAKTHTVMYKAYTNDNEIRYVFIRVAQLHDYNEITGS